MHNVFAASFESEYCLLLQSLSTCHLPLLPLTLSSCAILYLGKGSSLHLLSIRTGGKKSFGRLSCWVFWKGCWWLFFKTSMENFNTETFHPGNGAFARKQKKGEGSLKEQLNLAFQTPLHKETLTAFTKICTCRKTFY